MLLSANVHFERKINPHVVTMLNIHTVNAVTKYESYLLHNMYIQHPISGHLNAYSG